MARWTRDRAIEFMRGLAESSGRVPTANDMQPHHMTMVRLFGSICKAQEAAGFEPRRPGRPKGGA